MPHEHLHLVGTALQARRYTDVHNTHRVQRAQQLLGVYVPLRHTNSKQRWQAVRHICRRHSHTVRLNVPSNYEHTEAGLSPERAESSHGNGRYTASNCIGALIADSGLKSATAICYVYRHYAVTGYQSDATKRPPGRPSRVVWSMLNPTRL